MKTIGITGGIASGKSLVTKKIFDLGIPVIDADVAARKVVEKGMPALQEIAEKFGLDYIQSDGNLDRKKLGTLIFSDSNQRQLLNEIVHPKVREWMQAEKEKYLNQGAEIIFMDIPLLYESEQSMVDQIIVVYVDKPVQLRRLMQRDKLSEAAAYERIAAQMPLDEKKARADYVIDNNGTEQDTLRQLAELLTQLRADNNLR